MWYSNCSSWHVVLRTTWGACLLLYSCSHHCSGCQVWSSTCFLPSKGRSKPSISCTGFLAMLSCTYTSVMKFLDSPVSVYTNPCEASLVVLLSNGAWCKLWYMLGGITVTSAAVSNLNSARSPFNETLAFHESSVLLWGADTSVSSPRKNSSSIGKHMKLQHGVQRPSIADNLAILKQRWNKPDCFWFYEMLLIKELKPSSRCTIRLDPREVIHLCLTKIFA